MSSTQNTKKKTGSLESEFLKIDNKLFELEKKYREYRIRKRSQTMVEQEEAKEFEVDQQFRED